jgi:hypothetical protein
MKRMSVAGSSGFIALAFATLLSATLLTACGDKAVSTAAPGSAVTAFTVSNDAIALPKGTKSLELTLRPAAASDQNVTVRVVASIEGAGIKVSSTKPTIFDGVMTVSFASALPEKTAVTFNEADVKNGVAWNMAGGAMLSFNVGKEEPAG